MRSKRDFLSKCTDVNGAPKTCLQLRLQYSFPCSKWQKMSEYKWQIRTQGYFSPRELGWPFPCRVAVCLTHCQILILWSWLVYENDKTRKRTSIYVIGKVYKADSTIFKLRRQSSTSAAPSMVDHDLKFLQTNQALQGGANSQADDLQEIEKE